MGFVANRLGLFRVVARVTLVVAGLSLGGCSTRYVERGPVSVQHGQRNFPAAGEGGYFRLGQDTDGDRLNLQLTPALCTTEFSAQPVATETEYNKASFMGGPGLAIGGVALAGAGTALFASSGDLPKTCAEEDGDCYSKDEARAASAVAWGLGGAGIAVGLYRTFKAPVALRSQLVPAGKTELTTQNAACNISPANVPTELRLSNGSSARGTTDTDGWVAFDLDGDAIARGTQGGLLVNGQQFALDLSEIARAEPASPAPGNAAACTLPKTDTTVVALGVCMLGLKWLADQGVEWASDRAANGLGDKLGLASDSSLRYVIAKALNHYAGELAGPTRNWASLQVCCVVVRELTTP